MDCAVSVEGNQNLDKRAMRLLSTMLRDRVKIFELLAEIAHEDDDAELKPKTKKPKAEINMYQ